MQRLYVLYDAECGLCSWARRWLMRQPAIVELSFIPAGSTLASRLFPGLSSPGAPTEELVVISDEGGVYREGNAWIMCLYALEEYRDWASRLSHPLLRPLARQAFSILSRRRSRVSKWLSLASEVEIAETLRRVNAPACSRSGQPVHTTPAAVPPLAQDRSGNHVLVDEAQGADTDFS